MKHCSRRRILFRSSGFTLMELLIVIALLLLIMGGSMLNWTTQLNRAHDARRKGDLYKMKAALENYINDHGCYPTEAELATCGGGLFAAYSMPVVPCDPDGGAYRYELIDPTNACRGYRLYTALKIKNDPDIVSLGCDGADGCRVAGLPKYNYGVAVGGAVAQ